MIDPADLADRLREFDFDGDLGIIWEDRSSYSPARYRYLWGQVWELGRGCVCWVLLNPSTADASRDDPTIRRCRSYSKLWGFGSFMVVNVFAMRATDPKELRRVLRNPATNALEVIGPMNLIAVRHAVDSSQLVVAGWGNNAGGYGKEMMARLDEHTRHYVDPPVKCFGFTRASQPKHPLYLRRDAELVPILEAARAVD